MPRNLARPLSLVAALLAPAAASAAGFTVVQHGGRGAGPAGALVARADDPSALRYNPAGLAGLDGFRLQAGLDFSVADVEVASPAGDAEAIHEIQFPPAIYLAWKPETESRWSFGLGLDSPFWSLLEWPATSVLGRSAIKSEVTLLEARAGAAWSAGPRWSVGAAARWLHGAREQAVVEEHASGLGGAPIRLRRSVDSTVEGAGFELATRWAMSRWGAGLVWTSRVELDGEGDGGYEPFDIGSPPPDPVRFGPFGVRHELALPETLAGGLWLAAGERTRVELDVALTRWSAADDWRARDAASGAELTAFVPPRRWRDTTALRAAVEHELPSGWRLGAGIALEESPVPDATRGFDLPYGDARVLALGASYDFPEIGFDLGWSYHRSEDAAADRFAAGAETTRFRSTAQVFSVSARWRLDRRDAPRHDSLQPAPVASSTRSRPPRLAR
jgi:long-chain fatty acid transport protein